MKNENETRLLSVTTNSYSTVHFRQCLECLQTHGYWSQCLQTRGYLSQCLQTYSNVQYLSYATQRERE